MVLEVVSIPVILLRRAKIRRRQKFAVGFFLCLSTVMIVLAIVRMCRISYSGRGTDPIWQIFWQTLESCVALLMASITAFRTIFGEPGQKRWEPSYSWIQRAKQRQTSKEGDPWHTDQLPIIPEATFANMKMPVRGQQRTAEGSATPGSETRPSNSEDEPSLSVKGGQQDQNV
jgi:hypothetical protein